MDVVSAEPAPLKPGLVSISFRPHPVADIVRAAAAAGLQGIEWGGDVHVPHGNIAAAREARRLCREEGLDVAAYGSYLRCVAEGGSGAAQTGGAAAAHGAAAAAGASAGPGVRSNIDPAAEPEFDAVLDSAEALGAPLVRVWAGRWGSKEADDRQRSVVEENLSEFVAAAAKRKLRVALEFHGGTLTDTVESTLALLKAVPGLLTLWQPPNGLSYETRKESLRAVLPSLANAHVFNWGRGGDDRHPLAQAESQWIEYVRLMGSAAPPPAGTGAGPLQRYALLEFMPDNELRSLSAEAEVLVRILKKARTGEGVR